MGRGICSLMDRGDFADQAALYELLCSFRRDPDAILVLIPAS
jgi:hypothetical protein